MPTTFVPPFDKGENDTLKAARALGFTEYCAAFQDFNTNEDYRQGIKVEAVSLVFANESLQSMKDKTEQFLDDAHSIDTFVVLYHPADFSGPNGAVNAERVKVLADYIDYLRGTGRVQFTKLDRSTTTGNGAASSSTSSNAPSEAAAPSNNVWNGILTGSLSESLGAFGLIAFACVGLYWFTARPSSKRQPPQKL